jgi:hypothetical protein
MPGVSGQGGRTARHYIDATTIEKHSGRMGAALEKEPARRRRYNKKRGGHSRDRPA